MSHKNQLSTQREGTIINAISSRQEKELLKAVETTKRMLEEKFHGIKLSWKPSCTLVEVISELRETFPDVEFADPKPKSTMKPDGGILSMVATNGKAYPILIAEKKNQGTNDIRTTKGLAKQAQGNAIERLGKNVIGFRTSMISESIFPFVCFGDGCDFAEDSSILDRVVTIAMFGKLNRIHLHNEGPGQTFNRGTFYFREQHWTQKEMENLSFEIAIKSVYYYFSKYGESHFNLV